MQVTTELRRIDIVMVSAYFLFRLKNWAWIAVLAIGVCLSFAFKFRPSDALSWGIVIYGSFFGVMGVYLATMVIVLMWRILFSSSEKNGIIGTHVYSLSDEGLHESTIANEGLTRWPSIQSVVKTPSYIFIRINSYLYHPIPRRAFSTDLEYNEFWKKAHDYWRQAA